MVVRTESKVVSRVGGGCSFDKGMGTGAAVVWVVGLVCEQLMALTDSAAASVERMYCRLKLPDTNRTGWQHSHFPCSSPTT